jgi:hypothetical protein
VTSFRPLHRQLGRRLGVLRRRLIRGRRWLGCDRNPLRRTVDRAETAIRLTLLVLILTVVPAAAVVAGRWADTAALAQTRQQDAATHVVSARLLEPAPTVGAPDPYAGAEVAWVPARWSAPDGRTRTGDVLAPVGASKGSTVSTYVDASGNFTDPPPSRGEVVGNVFMTVTLVGLSVLAILLAAEAVSHQILERRRLKAWDTEWQTVAPRWTGRHPA